MASFFQSLDKHGFSEKLGMEVRRVFQLDNVDLDKLNKSSCLRFAKVELSDGSILNLVIKWASAQDDMSKTLGLAREACFYKSWSELETVDGSLNELRSVLAKVFYAEGSMETGAKEILMEDISSKTVQLGYLFGHGNPNNWGKDLAVLTSKMPRKVDVAEATLLAFSAAAKLHATAGPLSRQEIGRQSVTPLHNAFQHDQEAVIGRFP